ncbi:unnamed protein product [Paramecium pentaurelia]|uniref:Uncharacterized protein n=1 Tax=Paramecium pentaurelia TaxID=43138 RepID=A0A8S1YDC1_9CILI|nr:unnamed protein product [Paramecium pentaurelia]
MINFGDQVGHKLFCQDSVIYTFSGEDLLILEKDTMKLSSRINVGSLIQTIAINGDIFILTHNSQFLVYSVDGKQLQSKQHKGKIFKHACFHNDHFIAYDGNNIVRVGTTCSKIYDAQQFNNINYIQYSGYKEQLIIADDKQIHVIGNEDKILRQFGLSITIMQLDDDQDLLACGLSNGQLILLQFSTGIIVQQDHWHAHQINTLIFAGASLYSAGQEGVIVQWHLRVARKAFFPRQGGEIVAMCNTDDNLIINIKGINQIKQISLMGQNKLPFYQGIHHVYPNSFITYQNKLITQGANGTLQVINPTQGTLLHSIPIQQRNYVSDIEDTYKRDRTIVSQFAMLDRFLIVVLSSDLKQTLSIFENINNFEFNLVTTTDYEIEGMDTGHNSIITWGNGEIRLWRQIKQNKGQFNWNCVFRGNGYKGTKILKAYIKDENTIIIITSISILHINIKNNNIIKEQPLDQTFPEVAHIYQSSVLVCNGGTITIYQDIKKQINTQFGKAKSISKMNENLIAIQYDNEQALILDLKQSKVLHGISTQKLVSATINGRTVLYSYINQNNNYKFVTVLSTERKASLMIDEQETANFEQVEQPEKPIIEDAQPLDPNVYRRLQLAKQARQIKELNIKEFLIPQSQMLPSLTFLADRVIDVLKQDLSEQNKNQSYGIDLHQDDQESNQQKTSLQLHQLKKLFK